MLEAARKAGITFSRNKFQFAERTLVWASYKVQQSGVSVDPAKLQALADFPQPTNITELRSFLGLVEQLAGFSSDVAEAKGPLC